MVRRGSLRSRARRIGAFFALALFLQSSGSQPVDRLDACSLPRVLHVVSHGKHSGIVVSRGDLVALLPSLAADIGREGYVEIGWGEERYYQAGTGTTGLALRAALLPNASVLQLVAFPGAPGSYFAQGEVVELRFDEAGYAAGLAHIAGTFTRSPNGTPIRLGPALYGKGWFYRAEGTFHLFNNCNSWVASTIEATGDRLPGGPTLTAGELLARLREGRSRCAP